MHGVVQKRDMSKKLQTYRTDPYLESKVRQAAKTANTSNSAIIRNALYHYFNSSTQSQK